MLPIIHLIIASCTGLVVLYADEQAFMWFMGKTKTMEVSRVRFLHTLVSCGLALLIITGGLMYYDAALAYLSLPAFILKMSLIFVLIINSYVIEKLSEVAAIRPFASLSYAERLPLFISGGISLACWVTVIACGLYIA